MQSNTAHGRGGALGGVDPFAGAAAMQGTPTSFTAEGGWVVGDGPSAGGATTPSTTQPELPVVPPGTPPGVAMSPLNAGLIISGPLLKKAPGALQASKVRLFRLEGRSIVYTPLAGGAVLGEVELSARSVVVPLQTTRFQVTARGGRVFDLEAQTGALRDAWVRSVQLVIDALRALAAPDAPACEC
jgi:hypothetical protein